MWGDENYRGMKPQKSQQSSWGLSGRPPTMACHHPSQAPPACRRLPPTSTALSLPPVPPILPPTLPGRLTESLAHLVEENPQIQRGHMMAQGQQQPEKEPWGPPEPAAMPSPGPPSLQGICMPLLKLCISTRFACFSYKEITVSFKNRDGSYLRQPKFPYSCTYTRAVWRTTQ